jgi:hypothetical protein
MLQKTLTAGDTIDFVIPAPNGYPSTDGWTLKYRLVPRTATNPAIVVSCIANASDYEFQQGPASTGAWAPDNYSWYSWLEKSGAAQSVDKGIVTILQDPRTAAPGYDGRSQARIALDACMAVLAQHDAGQAHVKEYSIGARHMVFNSRADIVLAIEFWRGQVAIEDTSSSVAKGLGNPRRLFVRFSRLPAPSCFGCSYHNN